MTDQSNNRNNRSGKKPYRGKSGRPGTHSSSGRPGLLRRDGQGAGRPGGKDLGREPKKNFKRGNRPGGHDKSRDENRGPKKGLRRDNRHVHRADARNARAQETSGSTAEEKCSSTGFKGFDYQKRSAKPASKSRRRGATPARKSALAILTCIRETGCYLTAAIDDALDETMRADDRAFARLLVTEVVSRQGALDELINSVVDAPNNLEPAVRDALRISFCELFYLDKPDYVVVDQGVELVHSVQPAATRLANYLLHQAVESKPEFPFGDPATDDHAAALAEGFPLWLFERLSKEFGRDAARSFMKNSNEPAPLFFMVNVARADGPSTLQKLVSAGWRILPVEVPIEERSTFPVFAFAERKARSDKQVAQLLADGDLVISDAAAQGIAMAALPDARPASMLEIGAGRGTKTILLQNAAIVRYGRQVVLDTLDKSESRTKERAARLVRARISERTAYTQDAEDLSDLAEGTYDSVFIDAPCSGMGTLRRHQDIRWRLTPEAITSLAHVGSQILGQAARLVVPGGQLTYATCTVFAEENERVVARFLDSEAGAPFELVFERASRALGDPTVQGPVPDAHFVAVFRRIR